jgi:ribosomal protein S18 acetylase RimI-like enzyme
LSYRAADLGDAEPLSALVQRALHPDRLPGWTPDAISSLLRKSYLEPLRDKIGTASCAHVAIADGAIVGFILCIQPRLLNLLVVDPPFQRVGIGTHLIERMLEHLASSAPDLSIVEVNATEYSLPFYRRLGFYPLSEFIEFDGCRFMRLGYWRKNPTLSR